MVSKLGHRGITPFMGSAPCDVLKPTTLFHAAGTLTEPPVSDPILAEDNPKLVETPAPDDEPPGARSALIELGGVAVMGLMPSPENANSVM